MPWFTPFMVQTIITTEPPAQYEAPPISGGAPLGNIGILRPSQHARGESRTRTRLPSADFESAASAIPPLGRRWKFVGVGKECKQGNV